MKTKPYMEFFKIQEAEAIRTFFFNSLTETNHDFKFFVDWAKVKAQVEKYSLELSILNNLTRNREFEKALRDILTRYPEVLPCFPLLLAIREQRFKLIDDFLNKKAKILDYDFTPRKLGKDDIAKVIEFVSKTGLKDFFLNLSTASLQDYLTGVEVGLDTNARKNRSGKMMESLIENLLEKSRKTLKIREVIKQQDFGILKQFGINVPTDLKNRRADFILIKEGVKVINIETNFYNVSGSKPQEIVDSYINRQDELKRAGFYFIWITDGYGWKKGQNQMDKAFAKIDYILNTKFVRLGLLEKIIKEI